MPVAESIGRSCLFIKERQDDNQLFYEDKNDW